MRLKSIRLAGFKSFVEPTKIPFPQQLTGVVGPNGCGKSNVIDAVRWVLGESSARNLRGDAMTDVIFNGSTRRAPASKASVELSFDNQSGRLGGEYGAYTEVAVRREVTRDGQNLYFLNGTRCRKKDITDLFLGTGLGPRSYAIIEQGMISRLIESKPQELRVFIDEAAGVSKYKERRRETENRISHTQENLQRLADIEAELAQQVDKLRIQAQAALRYRQLRDKQRDYRRRQSLCQLQQLDRSLDEKSHSQQEQTHQLELLNAKLTELDDHELLLNEQSYELEQQSDQLRAKQSERGAQLARLEEQLIHHQQGHQARQAQKDEYLSQIQVLSEKLVTERNKLPVQQAKMTQLETELEVAQQQLEQLSEYLQSADESYQSASEQFQQVQRQTQQSAQQMTQRQEQLRGSQRLLEQTRARLAELDEQLCQEQDEAPDLTVLEARQLSLEEDFEQGQAQVKLLERQLNDALETQEQCVQRVHKLEQQQFENQTRQKSLEQLVDSMAEHHYSAVRALREQLTIEPGWERAVEKVLGPWLYAETDPARCNDALLAIWSTSDSATVDANTLLSKVQGAPAVLLDKIQCATNQSAALNLRATLKLGESVITADGDWFGANWQNLLKDKPEQSVLIQQRQLTELAEESIKLADCLEDAQQHVQTARQAVEQRQRQLASQTESLRQTQMQLHQTEQQLLLAQQQLKHQQSVRENLAAQKSKATQACDEALSQCEMQSEQLEQLVELNEENQQRLLEAEERLQQTRGEKEQLSAKSQQLERQVYQLQLELQKCLSEHQQLSGWLHEREQQLAQWQQQLKKLEEAAKQQLDTSTLTAQAEQLRQQQLEAQKEHEQLEYQRATLREQISAMAVARKTQEQQKSQLQEAYQNQQLAHQELLTRRRILLEQLAEDGVELNPQTLEQVDMSVDYASELEKIDRQIKRLGGVNLAAEQEYDEQQKRLTELTAQINDLRQALEMLESAIAKIDRQTRSKFRETFDKVNTDLQHLFPQVFGGGTAWLELTEDDLLATGVTIMARPPGKRNSTISLLSGGEKALTALSLVFAIFRLNPAPFCMLDEVDAPLDEVNVGRFADLIARMSETVQFIFISHNRVTMEKADQLAGVTMHEPGVSRLVAVDIAQAVALAQ
ncbi:chromosome segregation protein SMC [Celerinatantimonas diazotrophica]|uniref:Chromosome partition protein Smc n=1 Tax=Celerinatantimonas diazotrophica TaxID=412034 RepID=A0A4R1K411_9GAMM|nr:chromosome segregation protein SMC [Celerinatantimonas diazotrophica]TCK58848.1 condensin subunit Smc [Celerinatantimonas diazotrophica]CAG9297480.1 Chromosome partition protein Smc [Celerinatantimonas diazotrophica]